MGLIWVSITLMRELGNAAVRQSAATISVLPFELLALTPLFAVGCIWIFIYTRREADGGDKT